MYVPFLSSEEQCPITRSGICCATHFLYTLQKILSDAFSHTACRHLYLRHYPFWREESFVYQAVIVLSLTLHLLTLYHSFKSLSSSTLLPSPLCLSRAWFDHNSIEKLLVCLFFSICTLDGFIAIVAIKIVVLIINFPIHYCPLTIIIIRFRIIISALWNIIICTLGTKHATIGSDIIHGIATRPDVINKINMSYFNYSIL